MKVRYEGLSDRDRSILQDLCISRFLQGGCGYFAVAMSRGLGWPMIRIEKPENRFEHVAVLSPDGWSGRYFDARGSVSSEDLGRPFSMYPPHMIRQTSEEEIRSTNPEMFEHQVETALGYAQALWQDLPWLKDTPLMRALAFASRLVELSTKTGYWIRDQGILYRGSDIEDGYVVHPFMDGSQFLITRSLK